MGDIVMIVVVPRFTVSWNKKRKGKARPAPALLDPNLMAKYGSYNNIHMIGAHKFHSNGLEIVQVVSAHALKIKPHPSEADLLLFQSSFEILNETIELDHIIQSAVNKAFCNKSRKLWHMGDQVQILEGVFVGIQYSIHEIDKDN